MHILERRNATEHRDMYRRMVNLLVLWLVALFVWRLPLWRLVSVALLDSAASGCFVPSWRGGG